MKKRGRPSYTPGIPRETVTISITEPTAKLLRQWVKICAREFEEMYPKDDGCWPRGAGEVIEEGLELWFEQMRELEEVADPVGFRAHAATLGPLKEDIYRARYVTGDYFAMIGEMDDDPVEFEVVGVLFEGEEDE